MVDFGNTLKTLRLREDMTQAQLAQKLGLTKSVISAYETGLRLPSYDVLIHVSKIFKVSTESNKNYEKSALIFLHDKSTRRYLVRCYVIIFYIWHSHQILYTLRSCNVLQIHDHLPT